MAGCSEGRPPSALGQVKTGQGLIARAAEHAARGEPWPEDRSCTDDGHIDKAGRPPPARSTASAMRVGGRSSPPSAAGAAETNDATELHGDADEGRWTVLFASDHYAVFTDVEFKYVFTDDETPPSTR